MKPWLFSIAAVSVSAGIVDILLPSGKTKKTFRVISGIVMLYVFIMPLKNIDENKLFQSFTFTGRQAEESLQSQYDMTVISAYEKGIENALAESLKTENITAEKISVDCESKNNEIVISKITVTVTQLDAETEKKIREIVRGKLNCDAETEIIGG